MLMAGQEHSISGTRSVLWWRGVNASCVRCVPRLAKRYQK
jgi:hypothetical protein